MEMVFDVGRMEVKHMEELILRYNQLLEKLQKWYTDSGECDKEYTKNFPIKGSDNEKNRYNDKYRKEREKLEEKWRNLNEQLDQVEEKIHAICPEFLPRKVVNVNKR